MHTLERLTGDQARGVLEQLVELLQDAVNDGASIGFVSTLPINVAREYWQDIIREVGQGTRILIAVRVDGMVVGSVQLSLCTRPNGLHRAEVQKLFVHTNFRRRGFARLLMASIEEEARRARRSLLYLDTQPHKPAEIMYRKMGWILVGEIPDFASSPDGHLHGSTFFYKKLVA
jgi:acetyltransferase